MIKRMLEHTY